LNRVGEFAPAEQMMNIRPGRPADRDQLVEVWINAVRATHHFLDGADIQLLLPLVREVVLPNFEELWVVCNEGDVAVGFMGLRGRILDALFIHPSYFRAGGGRRLVEHARRLKGPLTVSVNEQNLQAVAFYAAVGFSVTGKSPEDEEGRPFPVLHMRDTTVTSHDSEPDVN
jgi:putative acetyltransferase